MWFLPIFRFPEHGKCEVNPVELVDLLITIDIMYYSVELIIKRIIGRGFIMVKQEAMVYSKVFKRLKGSRNIFQNAFEGGEWKEIYHLCETGGRRQAHLSVERAQSSSISDFFFMVVMITFCS